MSIILRIMPVLSSATRRTGIISKKPAPRFILLLCLIGSWRRKASLPIQSFAPTGWMNNWGGGNKELYQKLKKEVLTALIDKAREIIADLHDHVEFADLA